MGGDATGATGSLRRHPARLVLGDALAVRVSAPLVASATTAPPARRGHSSRRGGGAKLRSTSPVKAWNSINRPSGSRAKKL